MKVTKNIPSLLAVACVAAAFALCMAVHPSQAAPAGAAARASMRRGLDWLKSVQKENGAWSNESYPAMTALPLWAFARSDHPDKAAVCAKAADFVAGFAQEDGGIYKPATGGRGSGGLSTYNTAVSMIALHGYDRVKYADLILEARKFMAESQLVGDSAGAGGFGYNHTAPGGIRGLLMKLTGRSRADLSNTAWALHAMRVTQDEEDMRPGEQKVDVKWQAALDYLEALQNSDKDDTAHYGGFGYERGGSRGGTHESEKDGTVRLNGYGSMTYAGLESMIYADVDRTDPRVRSAVAWAARHWSVDENPGMGQKGLFYYFNIMSKALSLYGADKLESPDGKSVPWKKELVEKLTAVQREDGSWVNEDNQFWEGDPVLVTSYAVLALEYAAGR